MTAVPYAPLIREPRLPLSPMIGYVNVSVEKFIALVQDKGSPRRVQKVLLCTIDQVFLPLHPDDNQHHQEPVYKKKLLKGDCIWYTNKKNISWIIDTATQTITLSEH